MTTTGVSRDTAPGRRTGLDDLSAREREVLTMITNGLSNDQIRTELYLSINSVKTYVRSIYHKIGVTSRTRAVIWGVRHGLLKDDDERPWR